MNNKNNYWKISTIILTIILIAIITYGSSAIKSATETKTLECKNLDILRETIGSSELKAKEFETGIVDSKIAGQNVLNFAESQEANAKLLSTSDDGSLYKVILLIDEQEVPVYVTKDGKTLVPQPISLEVK